MIFTLRLAITKDQMQTLKPTVCDLIRKCKSPFSPDPAQMEIILLRVRRSEAICIIMTVINSNLSFLAGILSHYFLHTFPDWRLYLWKLTPRTVNSRVMKKRRGLCPMQHLVAIKKNCSCAIWRTVLAKIEQKH